jgi:hypothetical protein
MEESLELKREYKHFLRYDQSCFDGIEYGFTDLFYDIHGSTLFIKKVDSVTKTDRELEIHLENKNLSSEVLLEDYLINLMSHNGNFIGTPQYEKSEMFSKESFDKMLDKGISMMVERDGMAKSLNSENELINYCKSVGLYPEPVDGNVNNWKANCPSGGKHYIMISTISNEWGCGYCRKKGDINSLKKWYESKNNII